MKKYAILLVDFMNLSDEPEHVKNITTDLDGLKKELLKLQEGYSQDEKPEIVTKVFNKNVETLVAMSDSDLSYISPIKRI